MKTLVQIVNKEPRVSHRIIAENTDNKQGNINQMISKNILDFQEFGEVEVIESKVQTAGGIQKQKTFWLNEAQATLLMTYLRNSEIVKRFKKSLVKEFFEMRDILQNPNIYQLSGKVGGLTKSNNQLRQEVDKWKKKSKRRFENLEDDVHDLKHTQKLLPLKNLDEKLQILFRKSDELICNKESGYVGGLQNHNRFYREYIQILQSDGDDLQKWAINEIEKSQRRYIDSEKDAYFHKYKYEILMEKVQILQNSAKNIINFDIEKEMGLINII